MMHKHIASDCFYSGKYKDALQILGRKPLLLNDSESLQNASLQVGSMIFTGEFDEAKSLFDLAIQNNVSDPAYLIPSRFFLGMGEIRRSQYKKANQWMIENIRLTRKFSIKDGRLLFFKYQGLVLVHFYRGNFKKCADYAKKAYLASFESDFIYGQALALDALGQSLCQMGEVQRGLYELNRSLKLAKTLGNGGLTTALEVSLLRFRSQYGLNASETISDCERLLKMGGAQNNFTRAEIYLEMTRQYILRGQGTKARRLLDQASQTIYENGNKRQLVRFNHRFAYLLYLQGESWAALALAKSVKSNLDPYVDMIFFRQLEGLERKIEKSLKIPPSLPQQKTGINFMDHRILTREMDPTQSTSHAAEDPLGDLIDYVHRHKKNSLPEILQSGFLSLVSEALDLTVGKPVIFLGPTRGSMILSHLGDIVVSSSHLTRPMQKLLQQLSSGATVSKAHLIESVWEYEYSPLHHDPLLHATIGKIRKSLEPFGNWLEWAQEGYRLRPDVEVMSFENRSSKFVAKALRPNLLVPEQFISESQIELPFNWRQKKSLEEMQKGAIFDIENYGSMFGVSKATATRDLSKLFQQGLVARLGKGRATCYILP